MKISLMPKMLVNTYLVLTCVIATWSFYIINPIRPLLKWIKIRRDQNLIVWKKNMASVPKTSLLLNEWAYPLLTTIAVLIIAIGCVKISFSRNSKSLIICIINWIQHHIVTLLVSDINWLYLIIMYDVITRLHTKNSHFVCICCILSCYLLFVANVCLTLRLDSIKPSESCVHGKDNAIAMYY